MRARSSGFYIAHHPWLDIAGKVSRLFKVGHTGDLSRRLHDDAYITCFPPPGWKYVFTLETESKETAETIETAVLKCCHKHRLGTTELVALSENVLVEIAKDCAKALKIKTLAIAAPVYMHVKRQVPEVKKTISPVYTIDDMYEDKKKDILSHIVIDSGGNRKKIVVGGALEDTNEKKEEKEPDVGAHMGRALPVPPGTGVPTEDEFDDDTLDEEEPFFAEEREYQKEATDACIEELCVSHKCIVQMACRSGKTKVAYNVIEAYLTSDTPSALILVPGLRLLRQTCLKIIAYRNPEIFDASDILLIGSDPSAIVAGDATLHMTTNPEDIAVFMGAARPRIVICTYQSSALAPNSFGITVFDEAHRVCGGGSDRPFNYTIKQEAVGDRLFMTATPAFDSKLEISMKNKDMFGGVAFRYYLRQGIDAGYVNDFKLMLVPAARKAALIGGIDQRVEQLMAAMGSGVDSLIVFCRDIKRAVALCGAMKGKGDFACFVAHSGLPAEEKNKILREFSTGKRSILFNCRLFQEGVEIPRLNGVFFDAPKHSPRDIIQMLCRPLNYIEGKPKSVAFIPVDLDETEVGSPSNLKRFASIVPYFDALMDEDKTLYEHLMDPENTDYPIECLGTTSLGLTELEDRIALLQAARRAARYSGVSDRLLRSEAIPWEIGFEALRRVVVDCNRYPKTVDAFRVGNSLVPFHRYYRFLADEYSKAAAGESARLEPFQCRLLETLPAWGTYGVQGPYPWSECMDTLRAYLAENGAPPLLDVHQGGYVGLDATPLERLSGAMTVVNQQTYSKKTKTGVKTHLDIDPAKAKDLDAIFDEHGLPWRKELTAEKTIDESKPTWIQTSYKNFKALASISAAEEDGYVQTHFPGWPKKHRVQESLGVEKTLLPPKWKPTRRATGKQEGKARTRRPLKRGDG